MKGWQWGGLLWTSLSQLQKTMNGVGVVVDDGTWHKGCCPTRNNPSRFVLFFAQWVTTKHVVHKLCTMHDNYVFTKEQCSQDGYCPCLWVPIFVFDGVLSSCQNPMFVVNHRILSFVKQARVVVTCSRDTNASPLCKTCFESQHTTLIHTSNKKNNAKYQTSK